MEMARIFSLYARSGIPASRDNVVCATYTQLGILAIN